MGEAFPETVPKTNEPRAPEAFSGPRPLRANAERQN
jgi:hypothetical protein